MFEALLRLRTWHDACVNIVVPDELKEAWHGPLQEWDKAVGAVRVWSASQWAPEPGVMWRGSVHIKVCNNYTYILRSTSLLFQNPRQPTQSGVSFPGYTLQLLPDNADSAQLPSLLEGVGLWPRYCPSHLELVQAVDLSTMPLLCISPLHCKLYPNVAACCCEPCTLL